MLEGFCKCIIVCHAPDSSYMLHKYNPKFWVFQPWPTSPLGTAGLHFKRFPLLWRRTDGWQVFVLFLGYIDSVFHYRVSSEFKIMRLAKKIDLAARFEEVPTIEGQAVWLPT